MAGRAGTVICRFSGLSSNERRRIGLARCVLNPHSDTGMGHVDLRTANHHAPATIHSAAEP